MSGPAERALPSRLRLAVMVALALLVVHLADAFTSVLVARHQASILAMGHVEFLQETNPKLDPQEDRLRAYLVAKRPVFVIVAVTFGLAFFAHVWRHGKLLAPVTSGMITGMVVATGMGGIAALFNLSLFLFGTHPGHILKSCLEELWPGAFSEREAAYRLYLGLALGPALLGAWWFERRYRLFARG